VTDQVLEIFSTWSFSVVLYMDLLSQLMNVHHGEMCRKATNAWWECNMAVVVLLGCRPSSWWMWRPMLL
jgi:hypothetical protein